MRSRLTVYKDCRQTRSSLALSGAVCTYAVVDVPECDPELNIDPGEQRILAGCSDMVRGGSGGGQRERNRESC